MAIKADDYENSNLTFRLLLTFTVQKEFHIHYFSRGLQALCNNECNYYWQIHLYMKNYSC